MSLVAFGLNHHTAPLAIREQLAFPAEGVNCALQDLVNSHIAHEAAILSTCNRTEIYCNTGDLDAALDWTARYHHITVEALKPYLYVYDAEATARHAFRVASGLDSMVLGETQILGQLKDAVRAAEQAGSLGTLLNQLFQRTFAVAKTVRNQTAIGRHSVSMAAAAVKLAEHIFPSIRELNVLFVGAGDMIELVATHFAAQRPQTLCIANRTLARASCLAQRFGGEALLLSDLHDQLARFDVVITSTASSLPIIGKGMVEGALKTRRRRPIFMLDLAVPRDIEAEIAELNDVFLYTLDDIAKVVDSGHEARQLAAEAAEAIIHDKTREFITWLKQRDIVPCIRAVRDHADRARRHALVLASKQLARGEDPQRVLETLSQQLTNKLIHPPIAALSQAQGDERMEWVSLISHIYHSPQPLD